MTTVRDGSIHRLSGSAGAAWLLLQTPRSVDQLISELASTYTVAVQEVSPQIEALIQDLVARGWVVEAGPHDG